MVRYIYKVDPENRSVTCMGITKDNDGRFIDFQVGEAKCHKDDEFDVNFGMRLARLRCERKTIKRNMNKHKHNVSKFNKKSTYFEKCADKEVFAVSWYKHQLEEADDKIKKLLEETNEQ